MQAGWDCRKAATREKMGIEKEGGSGRMNAAMRTGIGGAGAQLGRAR